MARTVIRNEGSMQLLQENTASILELTISKNKENTSPDPIQSYSSSTIMKFSLFALTFVAIASTGFAGPSMRADTTTMGVVTNDVGTPSADTNIDAKNAVVDDRDGENHRDLAKGGRGLGKKADGKNPDGYMCKLCCNDDDHC